MTILLPLLTALLPILTLPGWAFYFDVTPKIVVLLAAAGIACCLFAANARSLRSLASTRPGRRLAVLVAAQVLFLIVATAASSMPALSLGGSNWRRFGLVTQLALLILALFTAADLSARRLSLVHTLRASAVSASAVAVYTVLQYLGWDPIQPSASYHIGEGVWTIVRPPATIGHASHLGSYLVFAAFLAAALCVREASRAWRVFGAVAAALASFAIVLSGARAAILALFCGAILLGLRLRPNRRVTAIALALTVAGLALFYYSPLGLKLRGRTRWYIEDPAGGARLYLWRDSVGMIPARWIAGWGPETFSAEFPRFQSVDLSRAYPDFYHESPHNIVLDEFVAKGVGGGLVFLAFLGFAAIRACRALRTRADAPLAAAYLAGLLALQFNAFVLTSAFFLFLTACILLAQETPLAPDPPPLARHWIWPAGFAAFTFAAGFMLFAVCLSVADYFLAQTRRALDSADVHSASSLYERVLRWQPPGVNSDLYYSRAMWANRLRQRDLLLSVKAWQEAVQAGLRATRLAEDPHNAFYHLATIYGQLNDAPSTERNLRATLARSPNWFKPHWTLARLLELQNNRPEALAEAELSVFLGGGKHPEVLQTLQRLQWAPARQAPSVNK
ncbi:MAG: O-antigen ligase family protein [Bryobacterales bacterium]|nr:O-antigen ligase family protein [Bryobacterales bacterium]